MSSDPSPLQDDAAPSSEREAGYWHRIETFPGKLETAFQDEMETVRAHRLRSTGLAAVLVYGAFAISDRVMMPDAFWRAWAIRFLLVIPTILLCAFYLYRIRNPVWRETLLSLTLLLSGASLLWIAALSQHPNAAHSRIGVTLVVLFGNVMLNQRFRDALLTSLAMLALYGFALWQVDALPTEVRINNWLFCLSAVVISLIANLRMEHDQRRAYGARLREQERNAELRHAVELLSKLSAEDSLTQLANRREFDRRLEIEWGRARREGQPLALILIDVDFFKNYNDHYGHPAGDVCLRKVASALRMIPRRSSDLVARFGGEEFAALLPSVGIDDAVGLAERMREAVIDLQIPHATSRIAPGVTASFGIAVREAGMKRPIELLAAADDALYAAKAQGRNRVAVQDMLTQNGRTSRL